MYLEATPSARSALSPPEGDFLEALCAARRRLMGDGFLRHFGVEHQVLGGELGVDASVREGPPDQYVLAEVLEELVDVTDFSGEGTPETIPSGARQIIRASKVKHLVGEGRVVLR